jgi:4-amino-4-deoxy-L-arabinose transferase-like glycosyltransferase
MDQVADPNRSTYFDKPQPEPALVHGHHAHPWMEKFPTTSMVWLILLGLTLVGGFLRFWRLDHQPYWCDESHTITRICGTTDQMFESLKGQGFPPGWYVVMYGFTKLGSWWYGSDVAAFSPGVLRLLPAALGTCMPLAMYFLAQAFTDRRGALLVALLTAFSPYYIYYSRDLKMYMGMWLMLVLHLGLFFKWQETRRHWLYWPLWMLTGAIMVAFHSVAWMMVPIELLWLLTQRRIKSLDAPLFMLAIGLMALLPAWWYANQSHWVTHYEETGSLDGLQWIPEYTEMNWTTIANLPFVHLLGFMIPHYPPDAMTIGWFKLGEDYNNHLATRTIPSLATAEFWCIIVVAALAIVGMFPWRGRHVPAETDSRITRGRWWWVVLWIVLPVMALGIGSLPEGLRVEWPALGAWFGGYKLCLVLGVACIWLGVGIRRARRWAARRTCWWIAGMVGILVVAFAVGHGFTLSWPPRKLAWEPRYLGAICPALLISLAVLLRRLPTWPVRSLAIVFVLAVSLASALTNHLIYRVYPVNEQARIAAERFDAKDPRQMRSLALGSPLVAHPDLIDEYADMQAVGMRPLPNDRAIERSWMLSRGMRDADEYVHFLNRARRDPRVKTIVLTDRDGDIPDGPMSNEVLSAALPGWSMISEEHYNMYYEWHYYLFSVWRTRVWVRNEL